MNKNRSSEPSFEYGSSELDLFQHAINWKRYIGKMIRPNVGAKVLEVGAGMGGTTSMLCSGKEKVWHCLEPDQKMATIMENRIRSGELSTNCQATCGTIFSLGSEQMFDTILYIDVLEHIEQDRRELSEAANHLKEGGSLIVLSPAHNYLFSEFDQYVGHFRRYDKNGLNSLTENTLSLKHSCYLDSLGMLLSLANKYVLRSGCPTIRQVLFWDKVIIPVSRFLDPAIGRRFGKSILSVWEKTRRCAGKETSKQNNDEHG